MKRLSDVNQILMNTNGFAYMDDIIIGGRDEENCKNNLYEVLNKLEKHNVEINSKKSNFFQSEIDYLGFTITSNGIRPHKSKADAIVKAPSSKNVQQLQS